MCSENRKLDGALAFTTQGVSFVSLVTPKAYSSAPERLETHLSAFLVPGIPKPGSFSQPSTPHGLLVTSNMPSVL